MAAARPYGRLKDVRAANPPEFDFLLACCRWPCAAEQRGLIRAQSSPIDWALLEVLARRHRVEGLVWHALERSAVAPPVDTATRLSAAAAGIARDNLAAAAESARLDRAFEDAGIPRLFVKGLTLGMLAYGTILVKSGWDIDLLVPANRAIPAAQLMERLGYELLIPAGAATPDRLRAWYGRSKETVWRHPRGTHVELHTSLADNPMLVPEIGSDSSIQEVEIASGIALPTLARDELFAYLTVHGASSAWFRLKWLADLSALLAGSDAAEIERLYRRAQELGAGRAAGLALLLCAEMFDTPLSPWLAAQLRGDRILAWLVYPVRGSMTGRALTTEPGRLRGGTVWIHLLQFGLLPGLAYKLTELRRQAGGLRRFPA